MAPFIAAGIGRKTLEIKRKIEDRAPSDLTLALQGRTEKLIAPAKKAL